MSVRSVMRRLGAGTAVALGLTAAAIYAVDVRAAVRRLSEATMQEFKAKFDLKDLKQADVAKHGSGVIKEENADTKTLILAVEQVCDPGATGMAFVDPYCKVKLDDSAVCSDGRRLDRYRVEQNACAP